MYDIIYGWRDEKYKFSFVARSENKYENKFMIQNLAFEEVAGNVENQRNEFVQ